MQNLNSFIPEKINENILNKWFYLYKWIKFTDLINVLKNKLINTINIVQIKYIKLIIIIWTKYIANNKKTILQIFFLYISLNQFLNSSIKFLYENIFSSSKKSFFWNNSSTSNNSFSIWLKSDILIIFQFITNAEFVITIKLFFTI